jgi:hypothetical protein
VEGGIQRACHVGEVIVIPLPPYPILASTSEALATEGQRCTKKQTTPAASPLFSLVKRVTARCMPDGTGKHRPCTATSALFFFFFLFLFGTEDGIEKPLSLLQRNTHTRTLAHISGVYMTMLLFFWFTCHFVGGGRRWEKRNRKVSVSAFMKKGLSRGLSGSPQRHGWWSSLLCDQGKKRTSSLVNSGFFFLSSPPQQTSPPPFSLVCGGSNPSTVSLSRHEKKRLGSLACQNGDYLTRRYKSF